MTGKQDASVENNANSPAELVSLVLELKVSKEKPAARGVPSWWGRAAHALLLRVIQAQDTGMAQDLHEENAQRPFTASTLMGSFPSRRLDPQSIYRLRLTGLNSGVSGLLMKAVEGEGGLRAGSHIDLDGFTFAIQQVSLAQEGVAWSASTDYQSLAMQNLTASQAPPRRITLQFTSPVTFKSGGKMMPIPLPELVFGSLLDRWNHFAPISFSADLRRYAVECLAVERYRLSTRPVETKGGGLRIGAVGEVSYLALNYDRYWMSLVLSLIHI